MKFIGLDYQYKNIKGRIDTRILDVLDCCQYIMSSEVPVSEMMATDFSLIMHPDIDVEDLRLSELD